MKCPCHSGKTFTQCCEAFLQGKAVPKTAEALMRSRYAAYARGDGPYLKSTLSKKASKDFDAEATRQWTSEVEWLGLQIISTQQGGLEDKTGTVEFVATYTAEGETIEHHELSRFIRDSQGDWKFSEGDVHTHKAGESCGRDMSVAKQETVVRQTPKVGRNDPCSCGSGKKFKKCCG